MSTLKGPIAGRLMIAALGLGAIAMIDSRIQTVDAGQNSSQPIRCELKVREHDNGVALEGIVFAKTAVEGSYQLQVSQVGGAGTSAINQSGGFSAAPGTPSSLAIVRLGSGDGGTYVAKLKVTSNGSTIECTERVRGAL
jgi:hypothetical protein